MGEGGQKVQILVIDISFEAVMYSMMSKVNNIVYLRVAMKVDLKSSHQKIYIYNYVMHVNST